MTPLCGLNKLDSFLKCLRHVTTSFLFLTWLPLLQSQQSYAAVLESQALWGPGGP
jgi:hypothetical protein